MAGYTQAAAERSAAVLYFMEVISMSRIKEYLVSKKDEMISLLTELVAVRSVEGEPEEGYPFGREPAEALGIMLKKCSESGFSVENVENYAGSADINDLEPELAVLSHLDVVPEGTGWSGDPFTLRFDEKSDKLIGRGAIDDKGPAVAALYAAKAVKDLGIPLKKGVRLIFGTNEETGSADMEYYKSVRKMPPMVFTPDGEYPVINGEKGRVQLRFSCPYSEKEFNSIDTDNPLNAVPGECTYTSPANEYDELIYDHKVIGMAAHASTPEKGVNALTLFLEQYADKLESPQLRALSKLFPHGEFDGSSAGLGFSDELSGKMTCVLSTAETYSDRIVFGVDIRFPLDRSFDEISSIICGKLREAGFEIDSCEGAEPHFTDGNSPFVKSLLKAYERVTGDPGHCIAIGGGTYVHEIEGGVAFGAEFPGTDGNMHGADEFITVSDLLRNAEIMAEAIVEICG